MSCSNATPILLQGRHGKLAATWMTCRCWTCPHCKKTLVQVWQAHLKDLILGCSRIWIGKVCTPEWRRLYDHLHRSRARFATVLCGMGRWLVVATEPFPGGEESSPKSVVPILLDAIRAIDNAWRTDGDNPVSTSHGWSLPKRMSSAKLYLRDGKPVFVRPDALREACQAKEVPCHTRMWHGQDMAIADCSKLNSLAIDMLVDVAVAWSKATQPDNHSYASRPPARKDYRDELAAESLDDPFWWESMV